MVTAYIDSAQVLQDSYNEDLVCLNVNLLGGASAGTPVPVQQAKSATATLSNVASSASSVTLLALNAARLGASIYNDSSAILYVKFGSTASSTSHVVQIAGGGYYELPTTSVYTGIITGIWASATGSARVTELTA